MEMNELKHKSKNNQDTRNNQEYVYRTHPSTTLRTQILLLDNHTIKQQIYKLGAEIMKQGNKKSHAAPPLNFF